MTSPGRQVLVAAADNDLWAEPTEELALNDWKPAGYPSLSPYLICDDAPALITFLQEAFDGKLLRRFDRPDGSLMHAEVRIDDSVVMIGGAATDARSAPVHLHLYVRDVRAAFDRAVAAGASVVQPPERKRADDDLRGGVQDAWGTIWWLGTR